ncbi:MAG: hypothetical protein KC646_10460 [Candidatus Cloacimonetes bacterium]|nr:hypothetical protein [Candidatus Cloacimonadota bacterium]
MLHSEKQIVQTITGICDFLNSCASHNSDLYKEQHLLGLFPKTCVTRMTPFFKDELIELDLCIKNQLWIASSLMAFRVFEEVIDTHLSNDLKIDPKSLKLKDRIHHCSRAFNNAFVDEMHNIRKLRNKSMHADVQLSLKESLYIVLKVCKLVIYVYSFEKSDFKS